MSLRRSTGMQGARREASSGVTLLELLIVLSIMAIVAALVLPMFGGTGVSTGELKGAARHVAAGLRTFRIDRDANLHTLPRMIEVKLFTAQSDLVNDRVGAIRFFADGGSNGGRVTLVAGTRKYDIDIDWLTGRVAIQD